MEPVDIYREQGYNRPPQNLPNANAVLILGILSIVSICCYSIPSIVLGIIALVMAGKDLKLYNADPAAYTINSYKNLKAGRTCAIIGLVLFGISLVAFIFIISTVGFAALTNPSFLSQYH